MTEQPLAVVPDDDGVIDLNAGRAARREGKNQVIRVLVGATRIELPPEFPLDVLTPLRDINLDFGVVIGSRNPEQTMRDLITAKPGLVLEAVGAAKSVFEGLFCSCGAFQEQLLMADDEVAGKVEHSEECQWVAFVGERPSPQDIVALGKGLLTAYGLSLGEALGSSTSAGSGGATSKPTSSGSTSSTPEKRGGRRRPAKALASASGG